MVRVFEYFRNEFLNAGASRSAMSVAPQPKQQLRIHVGGPV